ncbi:MAG: hypothetical protein MK066_05465 [Crocinitomicaceae bacterium]|nr:hypothetical protein [Crocinitomicaceae bacterium]
MKHLTFLLFFITNTIFAHDLIKEIKPPSFHILSNRHDKTISKEKAFLDLNILTPHEINNFDLRYGIDGTEDTIHVDSNFISLEIPIGKHRLDFYINNQYYEISTQIIDFKPCHRIIAELHFSLAKQQLIVKKPVIYLYPKQKQSIEVNLDVRGELTFTYPEYNNKWDITVDPSGTIYANEQSYNYLFWESDQTIEFSALPFKEGFIVKGDSVVSFLENHLSSFGFTPKEQADFITYWAPNMCKNSNLYICFMFNDACNTFATLNITPKPNELARFYMLWKPVSGDGSNAQLIPQQIPKMSRKGFTVLEWGGAKLTSD